MYLTFEHKKIMVEKVKCLLNCLGQCWIITNINIPSIDQSNPFFQLHPNIFSKIMCNLKDFKHIHLKVLFLQKGFF
jgi:hypothetical protein